MECVPIYPLFIEKGKKKVVTEKQMEFLCSGTGGMNPGAHIPADMW